MLIAQQTKAKPSYSTLLAAYAVDALKEEAVLTPKPALVDRRGNGAHQDLNLLLMLRSAESLRSCFEAMAEAARNQKVSSELRADLARIGRHGEAAMMVVTRGSNTHRGAIWALGLLTGAASHLGPQAAAEGIALTAGKLAQLPDRALPSVRASHGAQVCATYGVHGARGEAMQGFPHVRNWGLPTLLNSRAKGHTEEQARLDSLLSIMGQLDDTCLLHRGGPLALKCAQQGARRILRAGGVATSAGQELLAHLDADLLRQNASPGGSADLLAATLFLDRLMPISEGSLRGVF